MKDDPTRPQADSPGPTGLAVATDSQFRKVLAEDYRAPAGGRLQLRLTPGGVAAVRALFAVYSDLVFALFAPRIEAKIY